jgi:hypothetical protein
MRPGKKLTTGLLPTFLCLIAMLIVACGGGSSSTTTSSHTKASSSQQVFIGGEEAGTGDLYSFDPALAPDAFSASAIDMASPAL